MEQHVPRWLARASLVRFASLVLSIAIFAGCGESNLVPPDDGAVTDGATGDADGGGPLLQDAGPSDPDGGEDAGDLPQFDGCQAIDVLFVIDDSDSMAEEQAAFADALPTLLSAFDAHRTPLNETLDYHVGITTTGKNFTTEYAIEFPGVPPMESTEMDFGPGGALLQGCGMSRRWVESDDADLGLTLSCLAHVGTEGASVEMPLLMAERAVIDQVEDGTNVGFIRDEALLAVVVLTDDDDCSQERDRAAVILGPDTDSAEVQICDPAFLTSTDRLGLALDDLKGGRNRWAATVIAAPDDCTTGLGEAVRASRLLEFAEDAGDTVSFASVCDNDLVGAVNQAAQHFLAACDLLPVR